MILAVLALGLMAGIGYLVVTPPKYVASAQLLLDPRELKVIKADAVLSMPSPDKSISVVESQVEIIRSKAIAERVLEQIGVGGEPKRGLLGGLVARSEAYIMSLLAKVRGTTDRAGMSSSIEAAGVKAQQQQAKVEQLLESLNVEQKGRTFLLEISYTDKDPFRAAAVANAFADNYFRDQLDSKNNTTRAATQWLQSRITELRDQAIRSEEALERFKADNRILSTGGMPYNERQISELSGEILKAQARVAEASAKLKQLSDSSKDKETRAAMSEALGSLVIRDLRVRESEAAKRLAEVSNRYGRRHPEYADARLQVETASREIQGELERIAKGASIEHSVAAMQAKFREEELERLRKELDRSNQLGIRLRELEREAKANQALYSSFLERHKEVEAQENLQTADGRVIAVAAPPTHPAKPRPAMTLALAFFGSLAFGVGLAFLKEYLQNAVYLPEDAEAILAVPHLASLPVVEPVSRPRLNAPRGGSGWLVPLGLVRARTGDAHGEESERNLQFGKPIHRQVLFERNSVYAQEIFAIKSALETAWVGPTVVLVTSALYGEGKSTAAVNLAHYAASLQRRTLLIDCDLRNPALTASMLPKPALSLVDILRGEAELADVVARDQDSGLYFCPGPDGAAVESPLDLLGTDRMSRFLRQAREEFDLVILDTAPLLPVVDTRALIGRVDKVVFMIKSESTSRDEVVAAFRSAHCPREKLLGIVLNEAKSFHT